MIRHIVMFKFSEEAEGKAKDENLLIVKEMLCKLENKISEIKYLEVGINSKEAPDSNFDLVLINDFNNMTDLDIYQNHPDHQEVVH